MKLQTALLGFLSATMAGYCSADLDVIEKRLEGVLATLKTSITLDQQTIEGQAALIRLSQISRGDEVFSIRMEGTHQCLQRGDVSTAIKGTLDAVSRIPVGNATCDVYNSRQWFRYGPTDHHLTSIGYGCVGLWGGLYLQATQGCEDTVDSFHYYSGFTDGPKTGMIESDKGGRCVKSDHGKFTIGFQGQTVLASDPSANGYLFEKIPIPQSLSHDPSVLAAVTQLADAAPHAPTPKPTGFPTAPPSAWPSTSPSISPTNEPTLSPTTANPTLSPTTKTPTNLPTEFPTVAYDELGSIIVDSSVTVPPTSTFEVLNYTGTAKAYLSSNVQWQVSDANHLVDGDFSSQLSSTGVSYNSSTCDVPLEDLGYVTIDLGHSVDLDGVRIFMEKGEYCNMYVNAWDGTVDKGPVVPIKGCPTQHAGHAGSSPAPTPGAISTASPTAASTNATDEKATRAPIVPSKCFTCGNLDFQTPCTRREMIPRHPKQCPPEKPYCMNDIFQENNQQAEVYKRCVNEDTCRTKWYLESSDKAQCFEYNPNIYTLALVCHLCCLGDECNANLLPPQAKLYKPSRRLEEATQSARQVQVQSTLCDTGYNVETADDKSITIPISLPGAKARFIRIWSGRSSDSPKVGILEIQPLKLDDPADVNVALEPPAGGGNSTPPANGTQSSGGPGTGGGPSGQQTGSGVAGTGGGTSAPTYEQLPAAAPIGGTGPTAAPSPSSGGQGTGGGSTGQPTGSGVGAAPPTANGTNATLSSGAGTGLLQQQQQIQQQQVQQQTAPPSLLQQQKQQIQQQQVQQQTAPPNPPANGGGGSGLGVAGTGNSNSKKLPTATGDPHFTTFGGEKYDFHGGCDLVFLHIPDFAYGKGLRIHIRTNITTWWSSIESAVVQIGKEKFELQGNRTGGGKMWLHGWDHDLDESLHDKDEFHFGGYKMIYNKATHIRRRFRINLGKDGAIGLETYKDFITVTVNPRKPAMFKGAVGLLGSFPEGIKLGRDGVTDFKDDHEGFGKEWQVLPSEPMLFSEVKGAQAPQECAMPVESESRHLRGAVRGDGMLSQEEAEDACDGVPEEDMPACIFDVLATNDVGMAGSY